MIGHKWEAFNPVGALCELCGVAKDTQYADMKCTGRLDPKDIEIDTLEARIKELVEAHTLRPMADVPIGETRVLAQHTTLGWFTVARACDRLEFRGREGPAWSGEYFSGWIPIPVLPDQGKEP